MKSEPISRPVLAVSIGLLALMASGPFLLPFHALPIPTYWSEWLSAALGLAAVLAGFFTFRSQPLMLPPALSIPAVLLLALVCQVALGRLIFTQLGLLYAVYLLWASLLLIFGRQLAGSVGLDRLADVLSCAFLLGALANVAVALAQWRGLTAPWIFPSLHGHIYGNLGQINHHVHYSWLGIASACYLRGRGWLARPVLWLLVLPLLFGTVISGSRAVFVYALIVPALAGWARRRDPAGAAGALLGDAWLLLPLAIGMQVVDTWVLPHLPEGTALGTAPATGATGKAGERIYATVAGPSVRLALARAAWAAFTEHPWLGQGAGSFPWASFTAAADSGGEFVQVAENAHNFILQILVEFGAPATAALLLLFAAWARRFFGQPWRLEHFWAGCVLGIGAAHALLEYPLWYGYFLGPAALLLGATDAGKAFALAGRRTAFYLAAIALAGATILASLGRDYAAIERVYNDPLHHDFDGERDWPAAFERLKTLHRESLLSPWAALTLAKLAEPGASRAHDRAALCERAIRFDPGRALVTRCAMQQAIAGDAARGEELTRAVLHAYPLDRKATADELAKGARAYPEILPLWHLSQ